MTRPENKKPFVCMGTKDCMYGELICDNLNLYRHDFQTQRIHRQESV